jgi:LysM repeat protein
MKRLLFAAAVAAPLPFLSGVTVDAQEPPPPSSASQTAHTVAPGETLSTIAGQYGTNVAALALVNDIPDVDLIFPGQVLVVPPPPSSDATVHLVEPGDTLSGIAARYGVDADALATANDLTLDTLIFPGDALIVPA